MPAAAPPIKLPPVHPGTYPAKPKAPNVLMLDVWSPEGVKENHPSLNARDLVRSCGYTYQSPRAAPPVSPTPEGPNYKSPEISGPESAPNPELDALNALRDKARSMGVDVDLRWGTRRLNDEIELAEGVAAELKAKEAAAVEKPTDETAGE